jgi:hypothetical protein
MNNKFATFNLGSITTSNLIQCLNHNPYKTLGSITSDYYISLEIRRNNHPVLKFQQGTLTCDCGQDILSKQ